MAAPQAWWAFNNALTDGSGNGNTLTNHSATFDAGDKREGTHAVVCDGISQYLSIANASLSTGYPHKNGETTADFTVGGWVQFTTTPGEDTRVYALTDVTGATGLDIKTETGFIAAQINDGSIDQSCYPDVEFPVGTWFHLVVRWQGSTTDEFVCFVGGVKQTAFISASTASVSAPDALTFGCVADPTPRAFTPVKLDDWFATNVALSDVVIAAVAATGVSAALIIQAVTYKRQMRPYPYTPGSARRRR